MNGPAPSSRKFLGLLAALVAGYFAGVRVAAAFGVDDPRSRGVVGLGPILGGALAASLRRRSSGS